MRDIMAAFSFAFELEVIWHLKDLPKFRAFRPEDVGGLWILLRGEDFADCVVPVKIRCLFREGFVSLEGCEGESTVWAFIEIGIIRIFGILAARHEQTCISAWGCFWTHKAEL